MDDSLAAMGLWRKKIATDSSCLFRAVSEHVFGMQSRHEKVRFTCLDFICDNKEFYKAFLEADFDQYVSNMRDGKAWGGHLEMHAMAEIYKRDFVIFARPGQDPFQATNRRFGDVIMLCYTHPSHYDLVYPKTTMQVAALCQSITYEVLYKEVFNFGNGVEVAVKKMLYDKTYFKHKKSMTFEQWKERVEFGTEVNVLSEEEQANSSDVQVALANRIPPFPFKVAKALDSAIYRNIEFDLWNEVQREKQRREHLVIPDLMPGVKCVVRLTKDSGEHSASFHAHIQTMEPSKGLITVFVEKLGKMCTVPCENVEALPLPAQRVLRQAGTPNRLQNHPDQFSLLSNFRDVQKMNTRLLQRGKAMDLSLRLPQAIAGSPPAPEFSHGLLCDSVGLPAQAATSGDVFFLERPSVPAKLPSMETFQGLWSQTSQALATAGQSSSSSSQQLGFQEQPQWESRTMFDLDSTVRVSGSPESPVRSNLLETSSSTRNSPIETPLNSALDLSTMYEYQQPQIVNSSVWASPPLASPGPIYDFVPNPFSYAVRTSPEHSTMAYGSAVIDGTNDTSGSSMTMMHHEQDFRQLVPPMTTSSYPVMPYASMMLPLEPPSPTVNLQAPRSADPNGSDLPTDPSTLRFFYNIGWDMYMSQSCLYSMHSNLAMYPYIADTSVVASDVHYSLPEGSTAMSPDPAPNSGTSTESDALAAAKQATQSGHPSQPLLAGQHQQGTG